MSDDKIGFGGNIYGVLPPRKPTRENNSEEKDEKNLDEFLEKVKDQKQLIDFLRNVYKKGPGFIYELQLRTQEGSN